MKMTSALANKLLKKLKTDRDSLLSEERDVRYYTKTKDEDFELPIYEFLEVQDKLADIEGTILVLKHALNVFNTVTYVEPMHMTIDQVLTYLPILSARVDKFKTMKSAQQIRRNSGYRSEAVEYTYLNYPLSYAKEAYEKASDELATLQIALDTANISESMEVDLTDKQLGLCGFKGTSSVQTVID